MTKSSFFHFFPVPAFLQMSAAGLSLSETFVRFVKFERHEGLVKTLIFGEEKIPPGVVSSGRIVNEEEIIKVFKKIEKEHNLKFVRLTIPDEKVYLFRTKLPELLPHEVESALEFKIEQNVPISITEAVFDFKSENHKSEKGEQETVVGVTEKTIAEGLVKCLRAAGMFPTALEIESQALTLSLVPREQKGLVLIVNFEMTKTGICLVKDGVTHLTTTFPAEGVNSKEENQEAFRKRLPLVNDELNKLMDYWAEHENGERSSNVKIITCGELASLEEFKNCFGNLEKCEITLGNPWINVPLENKIFPMDGVESLKYASAIGAALDGSL